MASLPVPPMTLEQLNELAAGFVGDTMQTPPMVSAVKIKGVPLYKLARKGLEVEREARLVHVYSFRFTSYAEPCGEFRLACTKGTYVRSIAHDLGGKVGCGAHLATLRRLDSGRFSVGEATPLADLLAMTPKQIEEKVVPVFQARDGMRILTDVERLGDPPGPVHLALGVLDGIISVIRW